MIVVTSYPTPDLDGVACSIAYAELLQAQNRPAQAFIEGAPHLVAQHILAKAGLSFQDFEHLPNEISEVFYTDDSFIDSVPVAIDPYQITEIVDHHSDGRPEEFPNLVTIQNEEVGAAATLIAEKFKAGGVDPTKASALLLYGAIIDNSLNFSTSNTSDRDREMATWLRQLHQLSSEDELASEIFTTRSELTDSEIVQCLIEDNFPIKGLAEGYSLAVGQLEISFEHSGILEKGALLARATKGIASRYDCKQSAAILVDLSADRSHIITLTPELARLFANAIEGSNLLDACQLELPHRMQRKTIVPLFRSHLEHIFSA